MGSEHQKDDAIEWADNRIQELERQLEELQAENDRLQEENELLTRKVEAALVGFRDLKRIHKTANSAARRIIIVDAITALEL